MPFRAVAVTVLMLYGISWCRAQATGEEPVYRFQLAGVDDRAAAKSIVHALSESPGITFCTFIPECGCFKMGVHEALDYAGLDALVRPFGQALIGSVHGSDGSVLLPETTPAR